MQACNTSCRLSSRPQKTHKVTHHQCCCITSQCSQQLLHRHCTAYDWHTVHVPYDKALACQKSLVHTVHQQLDANQPTQDFVILCQHPPVFTLGTASTLDNLRFSVDAPPFPLYRTERGGEVTYHGPGQLVLYPIVDLRRHTQDLHWYLRALEEVIIRALAEVSGINAGRVAGLTGVWVDGAKIAATGIRVSRWVTYHGIALNVCPNLRHFSYIVPCGIGDRPVTSVVEVLQRNRQTAVQQPPSLQILKHDAALQAVDITTTLVGETGIYTPGPHDEQHGSSKEGAEELQNAAVELIDVYAAALLHSFCQVFGVQIDATYTAVESLLYKDAPI